MTDENGKRALNDFGGLFDRREDDGDPWFVFLVADPSTKVSVRARTWFAAREQGIVILGGDYSTVDARRPEDGEIAAAVSSIP